MSIYATCLSLDNDEHPDSCARWVKVAERGDQLPPGTAWRLSSENGHFVWHPENPCTCGGDQRAPIVYQGSHVRPTLEDRRGGELDFSTIPPHIRPLDDRGDEPDRRWDFLRVGMISVPADDGAFEPGEACVLLDREQVTEVRDFLTSWLGREVEW